MDKSRFQVLLALWGSLFIVLIVGIATIVFLAYLAYILIGGAVALVLVSLPFLVQSWQIRHLPVKVERREALRLEHEQQMERDRQAHQKQMEWDRHEFDLRLQWDAHQFQKHITLTRIPASAKEHYYVLDTEQGGYQALPNVNMRQLAAPKAAEETIDDEATALPSRVAYDDIRSLVPRGHTLLGTSANGIETRPFGVLSTTWIVGGSKTGKTTTVTLKVQEAYEMGCWFCIIDPHRWKEDSLYNSIKGYSHRFLSPGVAVKPSEMLAVLKAFLHQAQARLDGSSPDRCPIVLIVDEVNHICNIGGLEGEDLALRKEIVSLLKSIAAMCGEELRGYNMFGWFISQKAAHLAWLRNSAMTVIAHKVLMMSERKLACNDDTDVARSMDTWPIGRVMVYGLDFPDGHLITQMALFTPRIVDADPEPQAFRQNSPEINSVSEDETAAEARRDNVTPLFRVSVSEEPASTKKSETGVSAETKTIIKRMANKGMKLREIAPLVGLAGDKYAQFQAVCIELGIKKVEEA